MTHFNQFTVNGVATSNLPFYCAVTNNSAPTMPKKKNKLYDLDMVNGLVVQTVEAYQTVDKTYEFILLDVDLDQIRLFKSYIGYSGEFTPFDDPKMTYRFYDTTFESTELDAFNCYEITVTFTCEPFAYEEEKTINLGQSIENHTNAPMYPRLKIFGNTSERQELRIGNQMMAFTDGITDYIEVECKHGLQNVSNAQGNNINSQVRGGFYEIYPGTNEVTRTAGITQVEILTRWGWL